MQKKPQSHLLFRRALGGSWERLPCVPQETAPGLPAAAEPFCTDTAPGSRARQCCAAGIKGSPEWGGTRATLTCSSSEAAAARGRHHPAWRCSPQEGRRRQGEPQTAAAPRCPACCAHHKGPGKRLCPCRCSKAEEDLLCPSVVARRRMPCRAGRNRKRFGLARAPGPGGAALAPPLLSREPGELKGFPAVRAHVQIWSSLR